MFSQLNPFMQKHDKKSPCPAKVDGHLGWPGRREKQGEKRNRKSGKKKVGRKKGGEEYIFPLFSPPKKVGKNTKVHFEGSMTCQTSLQGSPRECLPGLVNFVTAVAYHFYLNLPRKFSQPGKHFFGDSCNFY